MTGSDFAGLFPNYIWIDIEASSLSVDSWPCEFGWCGADLRAESFLIRPMGKWNDWSIGSELIHGISRDELDMHGIDAAEAASRINAVCQGRQVLSDNPEMDGGWLDQLFHDVGISQQFTLNDSRQLEAMAVALSKMHVDEAQSYLERVNLVFPHPHRAGPDARREAARFLVCAMPHMYEEILAMA